MVKPVKNTPRTFGLSLFTCLILLSCPQQLEDPNELPKIAVKTAWKINYASSSAPMTLDGDYLMIPSFGGLVLAKAATGEVLWERAIPNVLGLESGAVKIGNDIFMLASYNDSGSIFVAWFKIDGTYQGRIDASPHIWPSSFGSIFKSNGYMFWNSRTSIRFDPFVPFVSIGDHEFDPTGHFTEMYTPSVPIGQGRRLSNQVLSLGTDVIFTWENWQAEYTLPIEVIRLNATSKNITWNYTPKKASHFIRRALTLSGPNLLLVGDYGMELVNISNPNSSAPLWAFNDERHQGYDQPLIIGDVAYMTSVASKEAVRAFSMIDGHVLWTIPNGSSLGQYPQYHNGVLYVSAQEGILAIDTATGTIIGRDNSHPGDSTQTSLTFKYNDLFIHYTSQEEFGVEAIKMDIPHK